MNFKWFGPLALSAALLIGDQIRINRPGHKYRLTLEVETPDGNRSASGVMAVVPDRAHSRGGHTNTRADALFVDLGGGRNLLALLAHLDGSLDLDGMNYLALRADGEASGKPVSFNAMSGMIGIVAVKGALIPVLATFSDLADRATMRVAAPDDIEAVLGSGFRLHGVTGVTAEVVPNGFWPIDFGGALGQPVTRGIEAKLPWWGKPDRPAAMELRAAAVPTAESIDARQVFTRK